MDDQMVDVIKVLPLSSVRFAPTVVAREANACPLGTSIMVLRAGAERRLGPLSLSAAPLYEPRKEADAYVVIRTPAATQETADRLARQWVRESVDQIVWTVRDGVVTPYAEAWDGGWPVPSISVLLVR